MKSHTSSSLEPPSKRTKCEDMPKDLSALKDRAAHEQRDIEVPEDSLAERSLWGEADSDPPRWTNARRRSSLNHTRPLTTLPPVGECLPAPLPPPVMLPLHNRVPLPEWLPPIAGLESQESPHFRTSSSHFSPRAERVQRNAEDTDFAFTSARPSEDRPRQNQSQEQLRFIEEELLQARMDQLQQLEAIDAEIRRFQENPSSSTLRMDTSGGSANLLPPPLSRPAAELDSYDARHDSQPEGSVSPRSRSGPSMTQPRQSTREPANRLLQNRAADSFAEPRFPPSARIFPPPPGRARRPVGAGTSQFVADVMLEWLTSETFNARDGRLMEQVAVFQEFFNPSRSSSRLPAHLLLSDRDFTEDDYEALLALDDNIPSRRGASQEQIDRTPTRVIGPQGMPGIETRCPICLEDFEPGNVLRVMDCKHAYHQTCLDVWLARKCVCPICQRAIDE